MGQHRTDDRVRMMASAARRPHIRLVDGTAHRILWNGYSRHPVALLLLPWHEAGCSRDSTLFNGGTTIIRRDADGKLYGCRDVGFGPHHDRIVKAWTDEATGNGLPVEDHRS